MSQKYPGGFITKSPVAPTSTAASGVWTLDQQQEAQRAGTWPSPPIFIEDLFSTWLYTGNGGTQTITNGVNLSGNGGLVWLKPRSVGGLLGAVFDTSRGTGNLLYTESTASQSTVANSLTAFNSNGFTIGTGNNINDNGTTYVSWTFREQAKFFDIVTWTGDGVDGRVIPHNLGSTPGCILVKRVSGGFGEDWQVYHRSLSAGQNLVLNTAAAATTQTPNAFGTVNSTGFQLPNAGAGNSGGYPYVAYLFAHNAGGFPASGTGSTNGISCGSFTTDGSGNATVDLGYEPQWVLNKTSSSADNWTIADNMRGFSVTNEQRLYANLSNVEAAATTFRPTATGYTVNGGEVSKTYIYIAIRRGPMKVPTTGTSVFDPETSSSSTGTTITTNFPVDLQVVHGRTFVDNVYWADRLRGVNSPGLSSNSPYLLSDNTNAETTAPGITNGWNNTGFNIGSAFGGASYVYWNFRRAPGFFDEVCYTGNGVQNRQVTHNLTVKPELFIVKKRNAAKQGYVYNSTNGATGFLRLFADAGGVAAIQTSTIPWNDVEPTSTYISLNSDDAVNGSGDTYVAYLFASCPGVSKVGSYTGTGATQVINCGFTGGARFVLIKATSTTGDWYVWDSARGIVSGNDPYLELNTTDAEVTNTDWVDTAATGFELSNAGGNLANSNGVSYIFLAIA